MVNRCNIILFGTILTLGALGSAQTQEGQPATPDTTATSSQSHRHWKHGGHDPAKAAQHMSKELNLTADQQSKVKTILEEQQKQMQTLSQDKSLTREDKRAKVTDLRKNTSSEIRALLNADQQKKFDEMKAKREQAMANHHGKKGYSQSAPQQSPQQ